MPYTIKINGEFCAAMQLPEIDGPCSKLHGHTYQVSVAISFEQLNKAGIACDYYLLKTQLDEILKQYDYQHLNNHPDFNDHAPSSEYIAYLIYHAFKSKIAPFKAAMHSVTIKERGVCEISYSES